MSPMFTMVRHCRQDNIIYKCTTLHDYSSNRKGDILYAALVIFLVGCSGERGIPLTFKKK